MELSFKSPRNYLARVNLHFKYLTSSRLFFNILNRIILGQTSKELRGLRDIFQRLVKIKTKSK